MGGYQIGIIGYGHIGRAMHGIFGSEIRAIYDPFLKKTTSRDLRKRKISVGDRMVFKDLDLAIVCVPTPSKKDGSCDVSIVEEAVGWCKTGLILIKSTVCPGTTDKLRKKTGKRVVFSPEYFGESTYPRPPEENDPKLWPFQIFGGEQEDALACAQIFKPRVHPTVTVMFTDAKTAELTKYMENAWLALQVTFANEMYEVANALGVHYDILREGWALDPRVSKTHTLVYEERRGFGGKCLPKDIRALIAAAEAVGYQPNLLKQVEKSNDTFTPLSQRGMTERKGRR
ncbi:MAG: hypothetical protein AAB486_01235 [Patescibacteria group bacterium]